MGNTDENEIFENNIGLAYMVAHRYKNYPEEKEDIFQLAYEGLWKAVKKYDKDKSKFSTYAVRIMTNNINNYLRGKKKERKTDSLDRGIEQCESGMLSKISLMDLQMCDGDFTEEVENKIILEETLKKLKLDEKQELVFKYWVAGKRQIEIAKLVNISQPSVSRIIEVIKNKLKIKE